jgi:hypothetical protein
MASFDGTSCFAFIVVKHAWVRGCRISQRLLRHLTCGRVAWDGPHHNASCTRLCPDETRPT